MRLNRITHLTEEIQQIIIREAPHTKIQNVPSELSFLIGSFIDLGFENLELSNNELIKIQRAFIGDGVMIPGTPYKLRNKLSGITVIEPGDDVKDVLPDNWADAVLVLNDNGTPIYIGSLVRPDQYIE